MMKDLESYLVDFEEERSIKAKSYLNNFVIGNNIRELIIVITYDKYIFSINNRI